MFSISKLMQRLGLNGRLLAFFKAVCVYFAVSTASDGGGPTVACAAAKCAPIVCLLIIVVAQRADISDKLPEGRMRRRYSLFVSIGLALSALGDALLVWPQYFVGGMASFALAHVAYIGAFGWQPLAPLVAVPLYMGVGWYLWVVRATGLLRFLVPLYSLVLVTMAWRGAARGSATAIGAALFLFSDAALGYSMFAAPLPHSKVIVMSSYYLAQLGIAMSAMEPMKPPNKIETYTPLETSQPAT